MTRGWKTIRNFAVTAAILAAFFWLWGVYLSPETCVLRSMEELGFAPCEIVSELTFPNGNREYLMKNTQGKYAIHGAKRVLGLFWATSGGATGMDFDSRGKNCPAYFTWGGGADSKYVLCKRFDPAIDKVVWYAEDGTPYPAGDWHDDIVWRLVPEAVPGDHYTAWSGDNLVYGFDGVNEVQY